MLFKTSHHYQILLESMLCNILKILSINTTKCICQVSTKSSKFSSSEISLKTLINPLQENEEFAIDVALLAWMASKRKMEGQMLNIMRVLITAPLVRMSSHGKSK